MTTLDALRITIEKIKQWAENTFLTRSNTTVTLYGDLWVGEEAPYSQSVVIKGVGVNSTVDLRPTPEQAIEFGMENIVLQAINNDGDVVIYALDEKPTADYTIEAHITDSIIL